jgi:hypothetical protein
MLPQDGSKPSATPKVVVATTVALSFISFWAGASIVLSDLASSAFYAGGEAEAAIGRSAPWFVLGVMLFSFAVRSVYLESCSMYVRGGVYVVVRESMGPVMAKLSVSALVFDYILTGPISSVSAGQYLGSWFNDVSAQLGQAYRVDVDTFASAMAILVTIYFWYQNLKGVHESSEKALRIMQITTVMVVIILIWAPITILIRGHVELPPAPVAANLTFSREAQGWLYGTNWIQIPLIAIVAAFGHSLLSMSGFETLAQVYREIASPKLKNLKIAANIVCVYAVVSTGLITLFAAVLIPNDQRPMYFTNLIGGLANNLAGPDTVKLVFHGFVVLVGGLILSGAVNTSIIGANGVLNRVAEDGVLVPWFRQLHKKFGTTHHMINMIALLQIATILYSKGNMQILAGAYAFGVVWSFFFKALGVTTLRFQRSDQEYKVPFNPRIGDREIPIGLIVITMILGAIALANIFTKELATKYGIAFSIVLFITFSVSEHLNRRRAEATTKHGLEEFNLDHQAQVESTHLEARPGCVLVAVRDYRRMEHLKRALSKTNLRRHDIVVMTVRPLSTGAAEYDLTETQIFSQYEKELFSHVVELAEKEGKHVELLVVPGVDPFDAMVQTAASLKASRLVTGVSARMQSEELASKIGAAWEKLPDPKHPFSLEIVSPDRKSSFVDLGPHPPRLWPEDVALAHNIWLKLSSPETLGSRLHHRDVVGVALQRLAKDLHGPERDEVLREIEEELRRDEPE